MRENRFDFARQRVRLARNYLVKQGQRIEKAPKDGESRVLSLDLLTCELFQERFQRRRAEARALGVQVPEDAFAFSPDPAGYTPWNPDTMTHRYRRYARRVGITSSLKELRHYSATQLLAAELQDQGTGGMAPSCDTAYPPPGPGAAVAWQGLRAAGHGDRERARIPKGDQPPTNSQCAAFGAVVSSRGALHVR